MARSFSLTGNQSSRMGRCLSRLSPIEFVLSKGKTINIYNNPDSNSQPGQKFFNEVKNVFFKTQQKYYVHKPLQRSS